MTMPEARGLFHRVIAQSGPILRAQTREEAAENARALLKQLNIAPADATALEQLPTKALVAAREALFVSAPKVSYGPVVDGVTLPAHPFDPSPPREAAAPSADRLHGDGDDTPDARRREFPPRRSHDAQEA